MWDHVHAVRIHAQLQQPSAPVLGMHDHGVEVLVQPPLSGQLPRPRLARQHVVGGEHELGARSCRGGLSPRQQVNIEWLHGQPLEVHHVGRARGAPVAQHVRHVLKQLQRLAGARTPARYAAAVGEPVEELAPLIPRGRRYRSVGEAAREQLHLGAGRRQRAAQRVVIRRRVSRGVDDVDAHRQRQ